MDKKLTEIISELIAHEFEYKKFTWMDLVLEKCTKQEYVQSNFEYQNKKDRLFLAQQKRRLELGIIDEQEFKASILVD